MDSRIKGLWDALRDEERKRDAIYETIQTAQRDLIEQRERANAAAFELARARLEGAGIRIGDLIAYRQGSRAEQFIVGETAYANYGDQSIALHFVTSKLKIHRGRAVTFGSVNRIVGQGMHCPECDRCMGNDPCPSNGCDGHWTLHEGGCPHGDEANDIGYDACRSCGAIFPAWGDGEPGRCPDCADRDSERDNG